MPKTNLNTSMPPRKQGHPPHLPLRIGRLRQRTSTVNQPSTISCPASEKCHPPHSIRKLSIPLPLIIHEPLELLPNRRMHG
jgi:hypothetical protein